jgi:two-component system, sensor histidine kinase PdtaS
LLDYYPSDALPDAALALGLAVVAASTAPLMLLDAGFDVIGASDSCRKAFDLTPAPAALGSIFALGSGEWQLPRLRSLLQATLAGDASPNVTVDAYELDLVLPGLGKRRLVLHARRLRYPGDDGRVHLLLSITDVTASRLADEVHAALLREKVLLLQEIQHRIANSLQIVASVLMQGARRVNSEESRGHLRDAHSRVMAIAELQHHLSSAENGDVDLGAYLGKLCDSLCASMIEDHDRLKLTTQCNKAMVSSDTSVSLGLVVTELVINALKHAFDADQPGRITVTYRCGAHDWRLEVRDNGKGMAEVAPAPGLGTSIVTALARHLLAEVTIDDGNPGTVVSLYHRDADDMPAEAAL